MNYTLIFAGGIGSRMGSDIPKQFLTVAGKPIIIHTLLHFALHPEIDGIIVVSKKEYIDYCRELIEEYQIPKVLDVTAGGASGQESIYNGLRYLYAHSGSQTDDLVLIHDGVRPMITDTLISESIACARKNGSSVAVANAIETVIRVSSDGTIRETVDRSECRNAKAPQCFFLQEIWTEHNRARAEKKEFIDSASLMSAYGHKLFTVQTSQENIKITTPNDYYMLKGMLEHGGEPGTGEKK